MGFTSLQTGGPLALLPKAWVDGNHLVVYMFLLLSFKTCIFFLAAFKTIFAIEMSNSWIRTQN